MAKSVYIHIPFCKSICSYCDFCKMFYVKKWVPKYLDALKEEVKSRYEGEEIRTLYIGGGTPSALGVKELEKLKEIIDIFNISDKCEISFEANLNDLNDIYLNHLKNLGINRLSIGIESFNDDKLKLMGREATFDQANKIIKIARTKGFNNINIDFIYGLPNETVDVTKDDIKKMIKLNPDHISAYSLILEPNTKMNIHYKETVDEDTEYEMYQTVKRSLKRAGFDHYEISNYSKPGKYAKHNLVYWLNGEYYGFGLGACGYMHEVRYENTRNINKYINGDYIQNRELVSVDDEKKNKLMLGLRLIGGIDLNSWFLQYNENLENNENVKKLIKEKLLIVKENHLFVNPKKLYIMNEILIKLI